MMASKVIQISQRIPSQKEKNDLIFTLLPTAIKVVMTNHTYFRKGGVSFRVKEEA